MSRFFGRELRIYKPRKSNDGCASRFQIATYQNDKGHEKVVVFVDMAPQVPSKTENAAFEWADKNRKITVKLDDLDIGALLLVLTGGSEGTGKGLYHKNANGNTVIKLDRAEKGGFYFGLSTQREGNTNRLQHTLTDAEAVLLTEVFRAFIVLKYATLTERVPISDD